MGSEDKEVTGAPTAEGPREGMKKQDAHDFWLDFQWKCIAKREKAFLEDAMIAFARAQLEAVTQVFALELNTMRSCKSEEVQSLYRTMIIFLKERAEALK